MRIRSRAGAIALGVAVAVLAVIVIVSGIALLIGVALVAMLVAGAAILLRRIFGRRQPPVPVRRPGTLGFDPALEVFPPEPEKTQSRLDDPARGQAGDGQASR